MGAANAGKSSFINECIKHSANGRAQHMGGSLTTSHLPGTTLGLVRVSVLAGQYSLFDTPGIILPTQVTASDCFCPRCRVYHCLHYPVYHRLHYLVHHCSSLSPPLCDVVKSRVAVMLGAISVWPVDFLAGHGRACCRGAKEARRAHHATRIGGQECSSWGIGTNSFS